MAMAWLGLISLSFFYELHFKQSEQTGTNVKKFIIKLYVTWNLSEIHQALRRANYKAYNEWSH